MLEWVQFIWAKKLEYGGSMQQLYKWEERELAYFAGILDGEGTISLTNDCVAYLSVSATSPALTEWLVKHFGGKLSGGYKKQNANASIVYRWSVQAKTHLINLLMQVTPFLVIKQLQARLLLKYLALKGSADQETKRAYIVLFRNLNSVGEDSLERKMNVVRLFESKEVTLP